MRTLLALLLLTTLASAAPAAGNGDVPVAERPRLAVLTDIGGDPDDQQSMVRLMLYANEFEIEALVASAVRANHTPAGPSTKPELIREIVDAYGQVLPRLQKHATGWPSADDLRARILSGNPRYGRQHIGEGHDTAASRRLIELIDAGTPERPLNIAIWGGQTDLAQALWRVKTDRDAAAWREFTRRFRVHDINDQDSIADWMRAEFPGMFYILSKAPPDQPKIHGTYRGIYLTGDESLTSRAWVEQHIPPAAPLGTLYPLRTHTVPNKHGCLKEGDTPSWFFFLPLGGNDPADPSKPGWGGRFQREPDGRWRDLPRTTSSGTAASLPPQGNPTSPSPNQAALAFDPRTTVSQHRPAFQADFAKRLAWCLPQ